MIYIHIAVLESHHHGICALRLFKQLKVIFSSLSSQAFTRGLTKYLAPQGGAFTRVLKFEKLKAPLFPGPGGGGIQMTGA